MALIENKDLKPGQLFWTTVNGEVVQREYFAKRSFY